MSSYLEARIRECAARGLSQRHAAEVLGIGREKFREMCQAIQPPVAWPARNKSIGSKLAYEARRGICTEAQALGVRKGGEIIRQRHSHTVDGRTGTVQQLAPFYRVSPRTLQRRLQAGMTIEEAVRA